MGAPKQIGLNYLAVAAQAVRGTADEFIAVCPRESDRTPFQVTTLERRYAEGPFAAWTGVGPVIFEGETDRNAFALILPIGRSSEQVLTGALVDLSRADFYDFAPDVGHVGMTFSKPAMRRQLSELIDGPMTNDVEFGGCVELSTAAGQRIAVMGSLAWDCVGGDGTRRLSELGVQRLFEALMVLLLENVPNNYSSKLQKQMSPAMPKHLKRAIEYMHANAANQISVCDIARQAGTSVRALQIAFQGFKGTTPVNYLRTIRLEGVRKLLQCPDNQVPVGEIARSWGFNHMGRFSAAYFQSFGETPSQTARRWQAF